jgi:hypothetical protein
MSCVNKDGDIRQRKKTGIKRGLFNILRASYKLEQTSVVQARCL